MRVFNCRKQIEIFKMKRLELKVNISSAWKPHAIEESEQFKVIAQIQSSIGFDEPIELFGRKFRKDGTCVAFGEVRGYMSNLQQILEEIARNYFLPKPGVGQVCEVSNDQKTWYWKRILNVIPQIHGGVTYKVKPHYDMNSEEFRYIRPAMFWDGTTEPFTVETIDGEPDSYYVTWEVA